jgi:hypothetical protein
MLMVNVFTCVLHGFIHDSSYTRLVSTAGVLKKATQRSQKFMAQLGGRPSDRPAKMSYYWLEIQHHPTIVLLIPLK